MKFSPEDFAKRLKKLNSDKDLSDPVPRDPENTANLEKPCNSDTFVPLGSSSSSSSISSLSSISSVGSESQVHKTIFTDLNCKLMGPFHILTVQPIPSHTLCKSNVCLLQ